MYHDINVIQGASEPVFIPDITDKKPEAIIGKFLLHLPLEVFTPGIDPYTMRIMIIYKAGGERVSKGAGPAGYEYGFIIEKRHYVLIRNFCAIKASSFV